MAAIELASRGSRASVVRHGAELRSWQVGDTALLWDAGSLWPECAPVLFPVVGWTRGSRVEVRGKSYPLGLHGFARAIAFDVREQSAERVRLAADSTAATLELYPFDWALEVEHALDGPSLRTSVTVRNTGMTAMPYACGLHPGFRWPFAGGQPDDYFVAFDAAVSPDVPIITAGGLFTHRTRRLPFEGRRLALTSGLMEREALCFLDAACGGLRFGHAPSGAAIELAFENFPHVALWSRPPGRFLCIEPWTGYGDHDDASGDIYAKPSMRMLAPGACATHTIKVTYRPPSFAGAADAESVRLVDTPSAR